MAFRFPFNGGREAKSGETGHIQEHNDTADLFAFHPQDPQGRQLIAVFPNFPSVNPERWTAIGARRKQTPSSSGSEEWCLE